MGTGVVAAMNINNVFDNLFRALFFSESVTPLALLSGKRSAKAKKTSRSTMESGSTSSRLYSVLRSQF